MILAINTGSDKNSIALYSTSVGDEVIWKSYKTQSQELLPKINKLLQFNKVKLLDLKAVAVYQGPGSYTGLRVGISVANALAWSLNIPVIGIKKCYTDTLSNCQKKNSGVNKSNNVTIQQCNLSTTPETGNSPALEIAQRAQKIFIKKNCSKFTVLVSPYYGVNKI